MAQISRLRERGCMALCAASGAMGKAWLPLLMANRLLCREILELRGVKGGTRQKCPIFLRPMIRVARAHRRSSDPSFGALAATRRGHELSARLTVLQVSRIYWQHRHNIDRASGTVDAKTQTMQSLLLPAHPARR